MYFHTYGIKFFLEPMKYQLLIPLFLLLFFTNAKTNMVDKKFVDDKNRYIQLKPNNKFIAFAGCNNIMGDMKIDHGKNHMEFTNIISTKKFCDNMEKLEQDFILLLSQSLYFKYEQNTLVLMDKNHNNLLSLSGQN